VMQLGQDLRFPLESSKPLGVLGKRCRKDLDRNLSIELGVGGAIDLAHATGAQGGDDLVGAEAGAGRERHGARAYERSRLAEPY